MNPMSNAGKYEAVLLAPDGASVRDYEGKTVEEVWENVNDGGSRWIFYPFAVVVRYGADKRSGRITDVPEAWGHWKGRTLGTLTRALKIACEEAAEGATAEDVFYSV